MTLLAARGADAIAREEASEGELHPVGAVLAPPETLHGAHAQRDVAEVVAALSRGLRWHEAEVVVSVEVPHNALVEAAHGEGLIPKVQG